MAPTQTVVTTWCSCTLLLIYQPKKDERLSWPSWLTYSKWFTHISGHPSAVGWAQDSESSPVKDQRSTTVPRNYRKVSMQWHAIGVKFFGNCILLRRLSADTDKLSVYRRSCKHNSITDKWCNWEVYLFMQLVMQQSNFLLPSFYLHVFHFQLVF